MELSTFSYAEHLFKPSEWQLEPFDLERINLLVGRNATGKSRSLAVIRSLAQLINGKLKMTNGHWRAVFSDEQKTLTYDLHTDAEKVVSEKLEIDGECVLRRDEDGKGAIKAEAAGTDLDFQVTPSDVALVVKRDLAQHKFLEPIHKWAESVRYFPFGSPLGHHSVTIFVDRGPKPDLTDPERVQGLFKHADIEFPEVFRNRVKQYFLRIGYDITDVNLGELPNIIVESPFSRMNATGINVKERDRSGWTYQIEMSQGMFRALSIICQLSYFELSSRPSVLLIDDIGEGLDFERSSLLVQLLIERSQENRIQLVMSTNDRFIMNAVPLEHWNLVRRTGGKCELLNYRNSKALFDRFKMTGLNNFDFFAMNFADAIEGEVR